MDDISEYGIAYRGISPQECHCNNDHHQCKACKWHKERAGFATFFRAVRNLTNSDQRPNLEELLYACRNDWQWNLTHSIPLSKFGRRLTMIALWNLPLSKFPQLNLCQMYPIDAAYLHAICECSGNMELIGRMCETVTDCNTLDTILPFYRGVIARMIQ